MIYDIILFRSGNKRNVVIAILFLLLFITVHDHSKLNRTQHLNHNHSLTHI